MTEVATSGNTCNLPLSTTFISIGSCFANESMKYLGKRGVKVLSNPFGTMYNPVSIAGAVERILEKRPYTGQDLVQDRGNWLSLDHSADFDHSSSKKVLSRINRALQESADFLQSKPVFIITPGTAVVWRYDSLGKVAANCHRIDQTEFTRYMLSLEEIYSAMAGMVKAIRADNPTAVIITSLSPVRHNPGDLVENMESKSRLRVSLGRLRDEHGTLYFPSYEIVLDQLRDYSWYRDDGIHMADKAVDMIMDRFTRYLYDTHAVTGIERVEKYRVKSRHKSREKGSEAHFKHLSDICGDLVSMPDGIDKGFIRKQGIKQVLRLVKLFSRRREAEIHDIIVELFTRSEDEKLIRFFQQALLVHAGHYEKVNISQVEYGDIPGGKIKKYRNHLLYTFYAATGQHEKCIEHLDPGM
jgi:hypothetical protein